MRHKRCPQQRAWVLSSIYAFTIVLVLVFPMPVPPVSAASPVRWPSLARIALPSGTEGNQTSSVVAVEPSSVNSAVIAAAQTSGRILVGIAHSTRVAWHTLPWDHPVPCNSNQGVPNRLEWVSGRLYAAYGSGQVDAFWKSSWQELASADSNVCDSIEAGAQSYVTSFAVGAREHWAVGIERPPIIGGGDWVEVGVGAFSKSRDR